MEGKPAGHYQLTVIASHLLQQWFQAFATLLKAPRQNLQNRTALRRKQGEWPNRWPKNSALIEA